LSNKEVTLISQATFVPGKKKIRPTTSAVVFGDLDSGIWLRGFEFAAKN